MIDGSFTTPINSPADVVWGLLLERAEHPERFNSSIRKSEILERFPQGFVRQISYGARPVKERITIEEEDHRISAELLENPRVRGDITTQILPVTDGGATVVGLTLNYRLTGGATEDRLPNLRQDIVDSLVTLKNQAEAICRGNMVDVEDLRSKPNLGVPLTDDFNPTTS